MRDVAAEMGYLPGKECPDCLNECGVSRWPLQFFDYRPNGACAGKSKDPNSCRCQHPGCYSAVCTGHALTGRTAIDLFERKVEDAFRRHAKQDGITTGQMYARWGTTKKREAARLREKFETKCCPKERFGCGRPYKTMKNGPRDLTFDRIDPDGPFLPWNVSDLCVTCNTAKSRMAPAEFAVRHRCWQVYDEIPKVPRYIQEALL
jgi:hypothetical protein